MDDIMKRAMAAYFRYGDAEEQAQPNAADSCIAEVEGRQYAVLRNVNGVLAVYRVRNDGMLKRLKRWPASLEEI
jgi:hypothetical protein